MDDWLRDGPPDAPWTVMLAHGAGAPMDSPFMNRIAAALAERGLGVLRFEFPYMRERRLSGRRRGPGRAEALSGFFRDIIDRAGDPSRLVIGGKSMGGRVASLVADDAGVAGLVCLGYPFHPPGRPTVLRTAHLAELKTPALIVQGTRDPFGGRDEVSEYRLSPAVRFVFLEDGDHSFKPRRSSGWSWEQHLETAADAVAGFITSL